MTNPNPSPVYDPAAVSIGPRGTVEILAVEWPVPSSRNDGSTWTVALDPATDTLLCACPDRQYCRRVCKHEASVLRGEHKPKVKVRPRPTPVPAPTPLRLSAADLYGDDAAVAAALDRRLAGLRGAA